MWSFSTIHQFEKRSPGEFYRWPWQWLMDPRALLTLLLLALALALLPLPVLIVTLGAFAALISLLIWPWLIWVTLAVGLPISSTIALGPIHATDLILFTAIGLWFIQGVRHRVLTLRHSWLLVPLAIYLFVLFVSLLDATDLKEAATELLKWVQFAVILLIVPVMAERNRHSWRTIEWLIGGLVLGGVLQAALGIYQFIFRIGPEWFVILGRFMRASGSFSQPNPYAGYLGLTLPIVASLTLWSLQELWLARTLMARGSRVQHDLAAASTQHHRPTIRTNINPFTDAVWQKIGLLLLFGFATLLIGGGLVASWSRGGWLGALGSTAVIILFRSRRSLIAGGSAAMTLGLFFLLGILQPNMIPTSIATRFQDIPAYIGMTDLLNQPLTDENFAIVERLAHWDAAVKMWVRAPWLGVGPGNYATIYPEVHLPRWAEALGHAHNIYLNTLAESGIWGLIAYLLLWGSLCIWLWRAYQQRSRRVTGLGHGWHAPMILGVIGMLCHLSIHNFFDNLFVQGNYLHIALWIAVVLTITVDGWAEDSQTVDSRTAPTY